MSKFQQADVKSLDYQIVDVFTETALLGNGLAVVFDTAGLATERMQAIAREFNLSETTFIQRRDVETEKREGVRVRIFTTQEELPFAGHPTLGTASVLKLTAPETFDGDTITLALNVGPVPVRFKGGTLFGEMTQRDPEFGDELDLGTVASLAGLNADDLYAAAPPQVVSTGTAFAIVALRSHQALSRLRSIRKGLRNTFASMEGAGFMFWALLGFLTLLGTPAPQELEILTGERGCNFMGVRIQPRAQRRAARSATSSTMAWWGRVSRFMFNKVWRWGAQAIYF